MPLAACFFASSWENPHFCCTHPDFAAVLTGRLAAACEFCARLRRAIVIAVHEDYLFIKCAQTESARSLSMEQGYGCVTEGNLES